MKEDGDADFLVVISINILYRPNLFRSAVELTAMRLPQRSARLPGMDVDVTSVVNLEALQLFLSDRPGPRTMKR